MIKKILLIFFAFIALAAIITLAGLTLVEWYWPVGAAVIAGCGIGYVLRKRINGGGVVQYIIVPVYVALILAGAFYSLNYFFDDKSTQHMEQVLIERKYTKTRHRTERVGRHTRTGPAYKVYFIDVTFADGRTKSLEIPLSRYKRIRTGQTTDLKLSKGLFGIPVISLRES